MNSMQQTESSHASQGWLLAGFLIALVLFSAYFFMQRDWWLPELASVHGESLDNEFNITLAITGAMFILMHLTLAFLVVKFR